jgi:hypothetical protein
MERFCLFTAAARLLAVIDSTITHAQTPTILCPSLLITSVVIVRIWWGAKSCIQGMRSLYRRRVRRQRWLCMDSGSESSVFDALALLEERRNGLYNI